MKTRELVLAGILLALGLTMHAVTPALFGSVKPDFLLATMFIAILFQPKLNNTLVIGDCGRVSWRLLQQDSLVDNCLQS
jgi:hypothetical protein